MKPMTENYGMDIRRLKNISYLRLYIYVLYIFLFLYVIIDNNTTSNDIDTTYFIYLYTLF